MTPTYWVCHPGASCRYVFTTWGECLHWHKTHQRSLCPLLWIKMQRYPKFMAESNWKQLGWNQSQESEELFGTELDTHTHTKGSQHSSLGPPPEGRWHQSRQWRWRWCWRPGRHPGNYNFLAIRTISTFRSKKKGPKNGRQGLALVCCVYIPSLTIVYMYLYIHIYMCVCVVTPKRWAKTLIYS